MSEEQRVAEYRARMMARTRAKHAREQALAGSVSARSTNQTNWQPMIDWLREEDHDGREDPEEGGTILNLNPGVE
jgi:hypothetical protein